MLLTLQLTVEEVRATTPACQFLYKYCERVSVTSSTLTTMLLSLLPLLLLTTNMVLSVPRLYSGPQYNLHYLPPEDQTGDWGNPWSFSPTFPMVVPPSSDLMQNFGLTPSYQGVRANQLQEELKPLEEPEIAPLITDGRDLNRVAMKR